MGGGATNLESLGLGTLPVGGVHVEPESNVLSHKRQADTPVAANDEYRQGQWLPSHGAARLVAAVVASHFRYLVERSCKSG